MKGGTAHALIATNAIFTALKGCVSSGLLASKLGVARALLWLSAKLKACACALGVCVA